MNKSIYQLAVERLPARDIDHWHSDLYLRVSSESQRLVNEYEWKVDVKKFKDQIDGDLWYEIPFAYDPHWVGRE